MFDLGPEEVKLKILDCGAGPSSFNAEMTAACGSVVSCDPLFKKQTTKIRVSHFFS